MRISDWSSDVCSSDLHFRAARGRCRRQPMSRLNREQMAERVARDIPEGAYVNLGIGLPTSVANYLPADKEIFLQSENGLLGMGPAPAPGDEDPDLINAGKQPVTLRSEEHTSELQSLMRIPYAD